MHHSVLADETVLGILRAAGIEADSTAFQDLAERLNDIASALLTERYFRSRDKRGRVYRKLGRKLREQLYGDLAGLWIDLPGVSDIPRATFNKKRTENWDAPEFSGPFVKFVQRFCEAMADHIEAEAGRFSPWYGVLHDLRKIQRQSELVRDGLRLIVSGSRRKKRDQKSK